MRCLSCCSIFYISSPFCVCYLFVLTKFKFQVFSIIYGGFCRLSVEEEDREEPMVSDADHHEDFQVIS